MLQVVNIEISCKDNLFLSKNAKKRLKNDLKILLKQQNEIQNINSEKYLKTGFKLDIKKLEDKNNYWTVHCNETEEHVKYIKKEEKRKILKMKLRNLKNERCRTQVTNLNKLTKDKAVPENLVNCFKKVRKNKAYSKIPSPDMIIKNKKQYITHFMQLAMQMKDKKNDVLNNYVTEMLNYLIKQKN